MRIQSLQGAVHLPTGPVVEYGIVNHQKYSLRCNPPLDLNIKEIENYLKESGIKVKEIIIETAYNQKLPVGGLQLYVGFSSKQAALNFERIHVIEER